MHKGTCIHKREGIVWPLYLIGGKDEANNMATHIKGGSKLCTKNSLQSMSILHI